MNYNFPFRFFTLCLLFFLLLHFEGNAQDNKAADHPSYRIVAYAGGDMDMWQMQASKITHVNYAFANVNEDGEIFFRNEIEGGQPGPGITYRAGDKQNFTLMLKSLRGHLDSLSNKRDLAGDDRYLLTIASNDNQSYFDHTQMGKLHPDLDFINVMSYDMFSVGSETTGHHTGLYRSSPDTPGRTTDAAVQRHLDVGIPSRKIVVGVAFYGRSWIGVTPENHGLYQPFKKFYRFIQYKELTESYINKNGFKRYWDEGAKAPYLWNADKKIVVAYDDSVSLRHKADYIRKNNLGGVMYWHHSYDPSQQLLDTLYKNLQKQE